MILNCTWPATTHLTPPYSLIPSKALEACITNIQHWMPLNSLKLNADKTEFLPNHSKFLKTPPLAHNALTLKPNISTVYKLSFFHIHHISQIYRHLTLAATKTIVHSLVSS